MESALAMAQRRSPSEADQVEERLAKAKARIMGELPTTIFYLFLIFVSENLIIPSLNLFRSIGLAESLRSAAEYVVGFVNASGAVPVVHLHDILNHVREVALHGVHHGAAMALVLRKLALATSFGFFPMVF